MAVLERTITTIGNTARTTVVTSPVSPSVRGLLLVLVNNPTGNSTTTVYVGFDDGSTHFGLSEHVLGEGESLWIESKLLLTSTDSLTITLGTAPTMPFTVYASYNDGQ